jgi:hypothetical protein
MMAVVMRRQQGGAAQRMGHCLPDAAKNNWISTVIQFNLSCRTELFDSMPRIVPMVNKNGEIGDCCVLMRK